MKQTKLTKAAKGKDCKIRIPGVCSHDPETTVSCHYRLAGTCGTGIKPPDILAADGCDRCHAAIDGRLKTTYTKDELMLMHSEGVMRTILARAEEGLISV